MGGPVELFEYLTPKVSGPQGAECAGGGVAIGLLRDDTHAWATAEILYLWAKELKELAEGHILEIQGCSIDDGCADLDDFSRQTGQCVCHNV
jgi:hypothetical protein